MVKRILTVTLEYEEGTSRARLQEMLEEGLYAPDVTLSDPLDELTGENSWRNGDNFSWVDQAKEEG